jgi:AcrR family transcriptional regulator
MMAQKKPQNQPKVKKTRRSADIRPKAAAAALTLAAEHGWDNVTLADIATESSLSEKALRAVFADIWEILAYVLQDIAGKTRATVEDYLTDDWRENVQEILMTRFDLAQAHRAAFKRLPRDLAKHPRTLRRLARRFYDTMREILLLAGFPAEEINPATVGAFGLLYISIIEVWSRDDTPDMSRTMAAIDKRIGYFARTAEWLGRLPECRHADDL